MKLIRLIVMLFLRVCKFGYLSVFFLFMWVCVDNLVCVIGKICGVLSVVDVNFLLLLFF